MTRPAILAAALTIAACGSPQPATAPPEPAALTVAADKPTLTVSDTATLGDSDTTVQLTATLTCTPGHTAFGSVGVSDDARPSDLTQPQGYSGVLRVECTGQPQDLRVTLTSHGAPFRPGPALARAGFTLNSCGDTGCPWAYAAKTVTNTR